MAAPTVDTRDRLVTAAAELFRRQGYNGTGLKQVVAAAEATVGSLYHHFPEGKRDLTAAVLRETGEVYRQLFLAIAADAGDPATAVGAFFEGGALVLAETDFIDPCPIGGVAREIASTDDELRLVAAGVLDSWIDSARALFLDAGLDHPTATDLATTVVAAVEGGFLLARARRDVAPMLAIGRQLRSLVASRLADEGHAAT